jgi:hypothetical protein
MTDYKLPAEPGGEDIACVERLTGDIRNQIDLATENGAALQAGPAVHRARCLYPSDCVINTV